SGNLTQIKNPDNGLHTFAYDTGHRPTSETFANLSNSWAYNYGALATLTWGLSSNSTLTPAMVQGLGGLVAGGAQAVSTDPLGRVTKQRFDPDGRVLERLAPDGGLWKVTRDGQGRVSTATDPLGRTTSYTRDALGFVTQEELPDNALRTYQYQSAFHALTTMVNERGYTTKYGYDGQGHRTTETNALNQTTTYGYSS